MTEAESLINKYERLLPEFTYDQAGYIASLWDNNKQRRQVAKELATKEVEARKVEVESVRGQGVYFFKKYTASQEDRLRELDKLIKQIILL